MKKHIIICADDFAQNEDISDGILSLMQMRRINATSCLVNTVHWSDASELLHPLKTTHFIGLHLNLTFGQPLSAMWRKHEGEQFPDLSHLLMRCYLNRLDESVVAAEIQAQLDVFTHRMHIYPDFIDGHQHVHQLPIVRRALLAVHRQKMGHVEREDMLRSEQGDLSSIDDTVGHDTTFFRSTMNGWQDYFCVTGFPKVQALALLGGKHFSQCLKRDILPTNNGFFGVYPFKKSIQYRRYFLRFLEKIKDGGLIMCHPGNVSLDVHDPLQHHRSHELDYLMSHDFLDDLDKYGVFLLEKKEPTHSYEA